MKSLKEIVIFSNNVEYVFIATSGEDRIPVIDIERTNPFSHAPKEKVRIITKDDESINERMGQK